MLSDIIKLQEWPDSQGGDDHGRNASAGFAEKASTIEQHRAAARYHEERASQLKENGIKGRGPQLHSTAAASHETAANMMVKNMNGVERQSSQARAHSALANKF